MAYNVLVADDSLTIQKVVSITLTNGDFKLIESLNESDLLAKASSQSFDLILIDFNLSEGKSGYDLCKEVSKLAPKTPILAMLGTFDSVDDKNLREAGVTDKIVKPFESEKFIAKCLSLVSSGSNYEESSDEDSDSFWSKQEIEASSDEAFSDEADLGSEWVVEGRASDEFEAEGVSEDFQLEAEADFEPGQKFERELEGWGVRVPGVIGESNNTYGAGVKPPVINNVAEQAYRADSVGLSVVENDFEVEEEHFVVPEQNDLEYPDLEIDLAAPQSKLIPLEELQDDTVDESTSFNSEVTDPAVNLSALNELQKEIEEELSPDDFWAVDAGEDSLEMNVEEDDNLQNSINNEAEVHFHKVIEQQQATPEQFSRELSDDEIERIAASLQQKINPLIEEMIDQLAKKYCLQSIDKVAWEVIPDLAENLIRKEIQNISESVKDH